MSGSDLIAADRLVHVIQQMADQHTNPVLEVLGDQINQFQEEQKYPQPPLAFQQGPWRAFYHCHAVPDSDLKEHGHFHIFTNYSDTWIHVVALSMNMEGQPQAWVAVNRWVTDGHWLAAESLCQQLSTANYSIDGLSLVETWLLEMLQVFSLEIAQLLALRDNALRQVNENEAESVLLNDRNYYTLAIQKIDVLTKLTSLCFETLAGEIQ